MRHADLLAGTATTDLDHSRRAFGRYYTPPAVAARLAEDVAAAVDWNSGQTIRCIDPFCGDGRLVTEVLRNSHGRMPSPTRWQVWLYDLDPQATKDAGEAVSAVADELGLSCEIHSGVADAFSLLPESGGGFDIVVTNPPWEALKPDQREMGAMSDVDRQAYLQAMRGYDSMLATKLPWSQPERKFSGWGTNLSRCGLELALRLCRAGSGVCGIVLPASAMNDQSSARLRRWMFEHHDVHRIAHYPAEAKLFAGVDQPFVTVLARAESRRSEAVLDRYQTDGSLSDSSTISLTSASLGGLGYRVPCDIPGRLMQLLMKWQDMPALGNLEGSDREALWMGRELDETGYAQFTGPDGTVPFIKGRMIGRYATPRGSDLFITDAHARLPESVGHARVTWRDVSRRSQRRRVQATMIPADMVTGNSLHVAYFRDDDESRLLALLALLNSMPVELQVRSGLGTGHVSLGVVRSVKVPGLDDPVAIAILASLARQALDGDAHAITRIEATVAELYGLDSDATSDIERFFLDPYARG